MQQASSVASRAVVPAQRLSILLLVAAVAACGGSGGSSNTSPPPPNAGTPTPPPPPPPPPPAAEFEVLAGDQACGGGGCGGDSGDGSGVGSGADGGDGAGGGLGEMRNVIVVARKPDGTELGRAPLRNNLVSLYPRTYTGAFILEFRDDGTGTGEYFDEGLSSWVRLGNSTLHVLVPTLSHHVSANPLSEAAYRWALDKYGSESALTGTRMTEANNAVRDAFNARTPAEFQVVDVTNYAVAVGPGTTSGTLPNTHAGRFSTLLAAMPKAALAFNPALATGKPALEFTEQLKKDVIDDGAVNASVASGDQRAYDVGAPQQLAAAVEASRTAYASSAQPVPQPVPVVCFNPDLFKAGGRWQVVNRDFSLTPSFDVTRTWDVSGGATFQGTTGLLEMLVTLNGTDSVRFFYDPDLSGGLRNLGNIVTVSVSGSLYTSISTYTPPLLNRQYLLKPGESDTQSYTDNSQLYDSSGNPFGSPSTYSFSQTTTFVGYEDVTVPAGTFRNACRYRIDADGGTNDVWLTASGQGVVLKSITTSGGSVLYHEELVSGTVNGQPVR